DSTRAYGCLSDALVQKLETPDDSVQLRAALALSNMNAGDGREVETLAGFLGASDVEIRIEVAAALLKRREAGAIEALAKVVSEEPWEFLSACQYLSAGRPISMEYGQAIAAVLDRRADDDAQHMLARNVLRNWFWERFADEEKPFLDE